MKGASDLATMIGWNAESFARLKTVRPLGEYLKPALSPERQREKDAQGLRDMIALRAKRQERKKRRESDDARTR